MFFTGEVKKNQKFDQIQNLIYIYNEFSRSFQ